MSSKNIQYEDFDDEDQYQSRVQPMRQQRGSQGDDRKQDKRQDKRKFDSQRREKRDWDL